MSFPTKPMNREKKLKYYIRNKKYIYHQHNDKFNTTPLKADTNTNMIVQQHNFKLGKTTYHKLEGEGLPSPPLTLSSTYTKANREKTI